MTRRVETMKQAFQYMPQKDMHNTSEFYIEFIEIQFSGLEFKGITNCHKKFTRVKYLCHL